MKFQCCVQRGLQSDQCKGERVPLSKPGSGARAAAHIEPAGSCGTAHPLLQ